MFKTRTREQSPLTARFIVLGDAKVETKGDIGEQPDGVQLQQFNPPALMAD